MVPLELNPQEEEEEEEKKKTLETATTMTTTGALFDLSQTSQATTIMTGTFFSPSPTTPFLLSLSPFMHSVRAATPPPSACCPAHQWVGAVDLAFCGPRPNGHFCLRF